MELMSDMAQRVARKFIAKRKTFKDGRDEILAHLKSKGWAVKEGIKIPHATNRDKTIRVFFKTQAVYLASEVDKLSFKGAHSMHTDLRTTTGEKFLKEAEKFAETKRQWHKEEEERWGD